MTPSKLTAARLNLLTERPYYAHIALGLLPQPVEGLGTLAVTKSLRLLYDPKAIESWTVKQLRWVLEHEVNHILRDHLTRIGPRKDSFKWNIAGDLEINDDLRGAEWPADPVTPGTFKLPESKSAEWYFDHLPDPPPRPSCGSACGHAHPMEGSDSADGPAANLEITRRKVAREIRDHASKHPGSVPAGLAVWADAQLTPPRIDWRLALRRFVRRSLAAQAGHSDYTFTRPNRRASALAPIILPGTHSPRPSVAVVLDTSGSMLGDPFTRCASEIMGIVRALGARIRVLAVDCEVAAQGDVFKPSDIALLAKGGGGTDMGVGIAAAEAHRPGAIIVLTDGYTPWPPQAPKTPVLVCLTEPQPTPDWATRLELPHAEA